MRGLFSVVLLVLTGSVSAAELTIQSPLHLLAAMPQQSIDDNKVTLAPGSHQLLVRYEGVMSSQQRDEQDTTIRSEPQLIRIDVKGDEKVTLSAVLAANANEATMQAYAKAPKFQVTGAVNQDLQQQTVPLKGFLLGVDYQALLTSYLVKSQADVQAVAAQTVTSADASAPAAKAVVPAAPVAAGSREAALQKLFLQATPEERKRFVSWAVNNL